MRLSEAWPGVSAALPKWQGARDELQVLLFASAELKHAEELRGLVPNKMNIAATVIEPGCPALCSHCWTLSVRGYLDQG